MWRAEFTDFTRESPLTSDENLFFEKQSTCTWPNYNILKELCTFKVDLVITRINIFVLSNFRQERDNCGHKTCTILKNW